MFGFRTKVRTFALSKLHKMYINDDGEFITEPHEIENYLNPSWKKAFDVLHVLRKAYHINRKVYLDANYILASYLNSVIDGLVTDAEVEITPFVSYETIVNSQEDEQRELDISVQITEHMAHMGLQPIAYRFSTVHGTAFIKEHKFRELRNDKIINH
jgi:hypothetical protein